MINMPGTIIKKGIDVPSAEILSITVKERQILKHLNIHLFNPNWDDDLYYEQGLSVYICMSVLYILRCSAYI
jgi:hypothetical protein